MVGYSDLETAHHLDLKAKGVMPEIVGNEVHDQYGNIPEVRVKCAGLIVKDTEDNVKEFMYHSVEELLQALVDNRVDRCYFHNLKFDDSYIASYMRDDDVQLAGWKVHCKRRVINEMGAVYSDVLEFLGPRNEKTHRPVKHKCEIWDSAKIWASKLRELGVSFGVYKKGEGNEEALRIGCDKRMEEYCLQDCRVMMAAMEYYFERCREETNGEKMYGWMTAASTAYHLCMMHVKERMTPKDFRNSFPPCNAQNGFPDWLREGYKGAVPLLDPAIKGKVLHDVKVFDINSQYPDKMRNYPLPIGYPVKIEKPTREKLMRLKEEGKLWIAQVQLVADVKEGHRPTFLLKRKGVDGETLAAHINDLDGMFTDKKSFQVVTSVDIDYLLRDYDVKYMDVLDAVGFKTDERHLIAPFIDKWYEIKEAASRKGDKPMKAFAKLILNSLYGKFGANPKHGSSEYTFIGNMIRIEKTEVVDVDKEPLYLPLAIFTTSYGRDVISKTCNGVGWDHVAYTDTDSVHIHGLNNEECFERITGCGYKLHKTELGAYDYESRWRDSVYVRHKGYFHFGELDPYTGELLYDDDGNEKNEIKMAGANGFEGFNCVDDVLNKELMGTQTRGYRVRGGILLMDKPVSIDTRMDACIKRKVSVGVLNSELSEQLLMKIRKELLEKYA